MLVIILELLVVVRHKLALECTLRVALAELISASLLRPQAKVEEQTTDVLLSLGSAALRAGSSPPPEATSVDNGRKASWRIGRITITTRISLVNALIELA